MKKKENRLNTIIGMLREQPTLTIRELASVLDVSEMTIRRDLAKLKDSGLLVRALGMNMIGNAQQKGISPVKYDFHNEITRNSEAKRKIAMKAVELINGRAGAAGRADPHDPGYAGGRGHRYQRKAVRESCCPWIHW